MPEPEVIFTLWKHWTKRAEIKSATGPGIYLLAHFPPEQIPIGAASPLDQRLVYIGETHKQTFIKRWSDFARSAQTGTGGHAGGQT